MKCSNTNLFNYLTAIKS